MKEIEVKILEVNVEELVRKLEQERAVMTFDGEIVTTYYDTPKKRLERGGCVLRLRQMEIQVGSETIISFKRKIAPASIGTMEEYLKQVAMPVAVKAMDEHEVTVDSNETIEAILQGLGYRPLRRLQKQRKSYSLGEVHFDIDKYAAIPSFLEVEAKTEALVKDWAHRLGYSMEDAKPWTAKDVFEYYGRRLK